MSAAPAGSKENLTSASAFREAPSPWHGRLVDTASAAETQAAVREITGGCFCCRAGELQAALPDLQKKARPDVFLAEPVGSCTDLVATVLLPLEQVYKTGLRRAPMSVVLDGKFHLEHPIAKSQQGRSGQ